MGALGALGAAMRQCNALRAAVRPAMALPEELKDPELFLTDLERHELRRVFEYLAGYDQKYRLNAALTPKLERRSQIKAHMAKPHAVKLVNPVHGDAMTEVRAGGGCAALIPLRALRRH